MHFEVPLLDSGADLLRRLPVFRRVRLSAGIWQHPPYFHDGSAADLPAVVNHYDKVLSLGLSGAQKGDLVEFLKSI